MPDDIDRAQERDLQYQADMEPDRRYRAEHEPGPSATGECLDCGEPLADGRRFCDAACRDAWEHAQQLRKMRGVT